MRSESTRLENLYKESLKNQVPIVKKRDVGSENESEEDSEGEDEVMELSKQAI
jgi:hypothetical protein